MELADIIKILTSGERGHVSAWEKALLTAWRRAKIRLSYKTWMLFDFANTLLMVFTYFLLSFIILPSQIAKAGYGPSYFAFAVVGIAISHYVTASMRSLSMTIRLEQYYGTLESILSTPTSFIVLFVGDLIYFFSYSTVFLVIILIVGSILGANLFVGLAQLVSIAVLVLLLMIANLPIGVASAAMILKYKQGNPIGWALTWINQFFAGTFFPIQLLPYYLRAVSYALPLTFSLDAIRLVLIVGKTLLDTRVAFDAFLQVIYALLGFPIAIKIFYRVYDDARRSGKLGVY